jgi:ankyrin repeat protein
MCAAESGFEEIVMILIDAMNKRAKEVSEELRCPPQQSFGDIVRDYEGNHLDIQNELNGRTALMYAALNDHAAIVKILVEAGADMEITDNNGLPARQLVENSQGHNKDAILSLLPSDIGHAAKKRKIRHTTC